jgi:molybdopterin converting factor small subunit
MRVRVRFTGIVRHYVKDTERAYELPQGARVSDLLARIGSDYGPRLPEQMWDREEERFNPLIKATRKGAPIPEEDEELRDGDEIYIISRMAGG